MRADPNDKSSILTVPHHPEKCVWCSQTIEKGRMLSIGEYGREFWIHEACWEPYRAMMQGGG
jgi:hypothetical protein